MSPSNLIDRAKSAYTGENLKDGKLGEFLKLVTEGKVRKNSLLLLESYDRLSRQNLDESYQTFRSLIKAGIVLVTLNDRSEYSEETMDDLAMDMIRMVGSHTSFKESKVKADRLKDRWARWRQAMPAKKIHTRYPTWLRLNSSGRSFEPIPERTAIILRIFTEYAAGKGVVTIARGLNEDKIPCFSGRSKIWKTHYIQQLLRSRSVIGEYQSHQRDEAGKKVPVGEMFTDYFPRIISNKLWTSATKRLKRRGAHDTRPSKNWALNIFHGRLFCPYCGERMFLHYYRVAKKFKDGKTKRYGKKRSLTCTGARTGTCLNISWPYEEFESQFLACSTEIKAALSSKQSDAVKLEGELDQQIQVFKETERVLTEYGQTYDRAAEKGAASKLPQTFTDRWLLEEARHKESTQRCDKLRQELEEAKSSDPYSDLPEIDPSDPIKREALANALAQIVDRIHVYFAGTLPTQAIIRSRIEELEKQGLNRMRIGVMIREEFDITKTRFFVARLKRAGMNQRICYPRQAVTLSDPDYAPDDAPEDIDDVQTIPSSDEGGDEVDQLIRSYLMTGTFPDGTPKAVIKLVTEELGTPSIARNSPPPTEKERKAMHKRLGDFHQRLKKTETIFQEEEPHPSKPAVASKSKTSRTRRRGK